MNIAVFIFGALIPLGQPAQGDQAKGPVIEKLTGDVRVETGREAEVKGKDGLVLKEQAHLVLAANSIMDLKLDGERRIRFFEKSDVGIPNISWETGEASQVDLRRGRLRWMGPASDIKLITPLVELQPTDSDFILSYDDKTARTEIMVVKGAMEFRATNAEKTLKLHPGEKASFQGIFEEGEIAYDLLLKGRKIPRGKLSGVEKVSAAEMKPFLEEERLKKLAILKAEQDRKARAAADRREGVICANPRARLNECAWTPKGGHCVRRRCNLNGQWAEETTVSAEEAKKCPSLAKKGDPQKSFIADCDY